MQFHSVVSSARYENRRVSPLPFGHSPERRCRTGTSSTPSPNSVGTSSGWKDVSLPLTASTISGGSARARRLQYAGIALGAVDLPAHPGRVPWPTATVLKCCGRPTLQNPAEQHMILARLGRTTVESCRLEPPVLRDGGDMCEPPSASRAAASVWPNAVRPVEIVAVKYLRFDLSTRCLTR